MHLKPAVISSCIAMSIHLGLLSSAAQDATPFTIAEDDVPATCSVEPRSPQDLVTTLATPNASASAQANGLPARGVTIRVQTEADLPTGTPADPKTVQEITTVVREIVACLNARDGFRLAALVTDDFLRASIVRRETLTEERAIMIAATPPVALPDSQRTRILDLRDPRVFADGRVGVILVEQLPGGNGSLRVSLVILSNVDGRWLMDGVVEVGPAAR